ncbi:MAG TPA: hypothetical protein VNJ01_00875 [Bacteriovoracaceae bacterium]|nr:hypothetical protein [Bacteriovoracaceae bacterium]
MKYFIIFSVSILFSAYAQNQGQGTGTVPKSRGSVSAPSSPAGQTHVSPAGMGSNPSVQSESTTTTGTSATGPSTLGQQTYPNSGETNHRSNDVTGENMSNAAQMGSDKDPTVPSGSPVSKIPQNGTNTDSQVISDNYNVGPYKDGQFNPREQEPQDRQAQEEKQEGN